MMGITLRFVAGAALLASTAIGCTAAPAYEPRESTESKLLAPKALFKAKASETTTKETGIHEWRVFRGKDDFVLTGYDTHGAPVGGTAFRFDKQGGQNVLNARILDGTSFKATYAYGATTSATSAAKTSTQKLFHRAAADMMGIRLTLQEMGRGYKGNGTIPTQTLGLPTGIPAGINPFGGVADPFGQLGQMGCGGDLVSMLMGALQCVGGAGGLTGMQSNPTQLLQCALASQGAASTMGTCQSTANPLGQLGQLAQLGNLGGATGLPFDPMSMGMGMDPNNPFGQYGAQDPFGLGQMGQLGQTGQPGMPGMPAQGGMDPYGMDPYGTGMGIDPMGQGQFDPLGQGDPFGAGSCQSCAGGYDDFGVNAGNGDVGFDPAMGGGAQDI
jgi:hypothetical protein